MLFPTIKKVQIKENEVVVVVLSDGKKVSGIVDKIGKEHFWLRQNQDVNSIKERFSFKLDQIVKVN